MSERWGIIGENTLTLTLAIWSRSYGRLRKVQAVIVLRYNHHDSKISKPDSNNTLTSYP